MLGAIKLIYIFRMCRATSRRSLLEAGFLFVTFTSLRFKCIAGEENCKKTSISYSMVSLDQLPDTWGYDMEWPSHLLGQ